MLEALVSLRRTGGNGEIAGAEKTLKKAGDILVVKKSPALWGRDEKRLCLIVKIDDPELEARIDAGEEVIVHPFAEYVDGVMINRSSKQVDLSSIPVDSPGLDPSIESGPIDIGVDGHFKLTDLKSRSLL